MSANQSYYGDGINNLNHSKYPCVPRECFWPRIEIIAVVEVWVCKMVGSISQKKNKTKTVHVQSNNCTNLHFQCRNTAFDLIILAVSQNVRHNCNIFSLTPLPCRGFVNICLFSILWIIRKQTISILTTWVPKFQSKDQIK